MSATCRPQALQARAVSGRASRLRVQAARQIQLDGGAVVFAPERRRPKALVHFLGGAFVASTPHLVYPLLLTKLADAGYTCIATPFAVTFNHVGCARDVHAAFLAAVAQLRAGRGTWAAPAGVPTHGVGHSNGALLHALIGVVCPPEDNGSSSSSSAGGGKPAAEAAAGAAGAPEAGPRASNVLMSFNNLQVREAVPVPLDILQPAVQQLRGSDGRLSSLAQQSLQQAAAAAQQLAALPGPLAPPAVRQQQERLLAAARQWDPALLQLGSVFDEVGDGFTDFYPPPAETRSIIGAGYSCPATLLVQFTDDNTDETPEVEAILRTDWRRNARTLGSGNGSATSSSTNGGPGSVGSSSKGPRPSRSGGWGASAGGARRGVTRVTLPGTHLTPCGTSAPWRLEPGAPFGPAEALAAAGLAALQGDTLRLADRLVHWLDAHS